MTYCSQSITGRIHSREPKCRTICLRKIFPHEVNNMLSFKKHENVGPDRKAKYPLPKEGQPANLPRLLGGASKNSDPKVHPEPVTKYWEEGWYLWTGKSRWAFLEKTDMMKLDLQKQKQVELRHEIRKEIWHDYQEQLKRGLNGVADQQSWMPIVPPMPKSDMRCVPDLLRIGLHFDGFRFFSSLSLLVSLPPDFPIMEKIHKFLQPTSRVLNIMHDSFESGQQKQFASRVWEKVKSGEHLVLAQRIIEYSYEQWKQWPGPSEDDDGVNKKDSDSTKKS
jgi:hypothetical protein